MATLERPKDMLGASEIAAVMGFDNYPDGRPRRTAYEVYQVKRGLKPDFKGNEDTRRGNYLEHGLLMFAKDWLEERKEGPMYGPRLVKHAVLPTMCANLDALSRPEHRTLVEAKSSNQPKLWGEEGTDEIPVKVILQTHHQMACAGSDFTRTIVPVCAARPYNDEPDDDEGEDVEEAAPIQWRMYIVMRDERIIESVEDAADRFMHDTNRGIPPKVRPTYDTLRRFERNPGARINLIDEYVDRWWKAREERLRLEKIEKEAKTDVLHSLGTAEYGDFGDGSREVVAHTQEQVRFSESQFKADHPDLYEQYKRRLSFVKLNVRKKPKPKKEK